MVSKQLIDECLKGKRQAQNALYDTFARPMLTVCMRYSANRQEAEEILQEGFFLALTKINQFQFEGSFEGWLRRIMVNQALQKYRSKNNLHALVSIDANRYDEPWTDEKVHSDLSAKELLSMVQQLPKGYRLVFNLYVFEGLRHKDISAMLGISEGTSKSNLSDARRLLQKAITATQKKKIA